MPDEQMNFEDLLKKDGPIALVIKQYLRPAEGDGEPIFPPTYPMPIYRGRVHTVRDGEYRVSVELPPFRQDGGKAEKNESQDVAGYNIDEFKDGQNVCEIDSPQSQANRLEPLFETIKDGKLVPQIRIKVGKDQEVSLLADAGHRAADAVVRLSSLVNEFHEAFKQVQKGNHLALAKLAPTSILFGVWDSRGTQVKLPRIIKSEIRATNVERLTRSAQFKPAANFVDLGVVDESVDKVEGEKNSLSAEGMKHVPAPRAAGGVVVRGEIKRVVRINLVALRDLRAHKDGTQDDGETGKLQRYILGLALVAAARPPELNLREGCLLCTINGKKSIKVVRADGEEVGFDLDSNNAESFAETAAKAFFGDNYDAKDHRDAIFESEVANKFLGMDSKDREKIARGGPITADAIRQYEEKNKDPMKLISEAIRDAKKTLGKKPKGKSAVPLVQPESFKAVSERLEALAQDEQINESAKGLVTNLLRMISEDRDTHATFKALDEKIKEFKKQREDRKDEEAPTQASESTNAEPA